MVKLLISCLVLVAAILLFIDLPQKGLFWSSLQNSGHTLLFAVLTFNCLYLLTSSKKIPAPASRWFVLISIAFFGFLAEFAQYFTSRDASISDMLRNLLGVLIGWMLVWAFTSGTSRFRERAGIFAMAVVLLLSSITNPIKYIVSAALELPLPILFNFDYFGSSIKVKGLYGTKVKVIQGARYWSENKSRVLKLQIRKGNWSGVSFLEPHPDWTRYSYLQFEVFNPTQNNVTVNLLIHGFNHNNQRSDRYRRRLTFPPGKKNISIPIEQIRRLGEQRSEKRSMDMAQIRGIIIYSSEGAADSVLLFDNFQLE